MDKKKVKELIEQILKYCDQCYKPNWQPKSFEEFVKLGNICREAIKELSKSDLISVEDEPAPRLEWDGSWNDINKSTPIANGEAFKYPIIIYAKLQGVLNVGIVITPEELANIAKLATTKFDKVLWAYVRDIVPGVKPKGL